MRPVSIILFAIIASLIPFRVYGRNQDAITTQGKFKIQVSFPELSNGWTTETGLTDVNGGEIRVDAGSGYGGNITIGYGLLQRLDIDFSYGYTRSGGPVLDIPPSFHFEKRYYLASLVYRFPVLKRLTVKAGAGVGYYKPGTLEIDAWDGDYTIHYKGALAPHVETALEVFLRPNVAFSFGLRYQSVFYKEISAERNGVSQYRYDQGLERLDGRGINLFFFMGCYF